MQVGITGRPPSSFVETAKVAPESLHVASSALAVGFYGISSKSINSLRSVRLFTQYQN